jgi:hypothetical protein
MPRDTHGRTVESWRRLLDSVADKEDIPVLDEYRQSLQAMYREAIELAAQRDAHRAAKQTAARALKETLENGRKTATVMRSWIKTHYGHGSEQLVEFGIQPQRPPAGSANPPNDLRERFVPYVNRLASNRERFVPYVNRLTDNRERFVPYVRQLAGSFQ